MARELRSRLGESSDHAGNSPRKAVSFKSESTPVKAKRTKVESVIRITRSREPRAIETTPANPLSSEANDVDSTPVRDTVVQPQRMIQAHYKDGILCVTGIPPERRIKDRTATKNESPVATSTAKLPVKRKLEDDQRVPRKRRRVDWAARNARSPRRSQRNTQQDSTSNEADVEDHDVQQQSPDQDLLPSDGLMMDMSDEAQQDVVETHSPIGKQIDLGATRLGIGPDPFKSPATDVTDNYFDALAEQSGSRSPELPRKEYPEYIGKRTVPNLVQTPAPEEKDPVYDSSPVVLRQSSPLTTGRPAYPSDSPSQSSSPPTARIKSLSPASDIEPEPDLSAASPVGHSPTLSVLSSSEIPNLVPFMPFPNPLPPRSAFADREAYALTQKYPPLMPSTNFITALTSVPLSERSTEDLYELAQSTQRALQSWQDEYIKLDKKTAPVAGPFAKKPATGGRQPIDIQKWELEKEKELFGEGSVLRELVKARHAFDAPNTKTGATATTILQEGRELRKRRTEASLVEGLGISEDDAGALTEGKRSRRPARRFEIGQNGEGGGTRVGVRRRRGGAAGLLPAASHAEATARNGYDSDAIPPSIDSDMNNGPLRPPPRPPKRGRLSALQQSFSNNNSNESADTSPSPTPDPADGDFSDTHAPIRRRGAPAAATTAAAAGPLATAKTTPNTAAAVATPVLPERKQRKKSEKRSESMRFWWAERKKKAADEKAAAAAAAAASKAAGASGGNGRALESKNLQAVQNGKEKRTAGRTSSAANPTPVPAQPTAMNQDPRHNAQDRQRQQQQQQNKVFGPAGLDARGGVMETWADPRARGWEQGGIGKGKGRVG